MTFGEIINYFLYAISGFCFGIFASRYSVLAIVKTMTNVKADGLLSGMLGSLPQLLFVFTAFFIFPVWFITKTPVGGFFYCAVLIFFFNRGYRTYIRNR